jgi:hypothetical protein
MGHTFLHVLQHWDLWERYFAYMNARWLELVQLRDDDHAAEKDPSLQLPSKEHGADEKG